MTDMIERASQAMCLALRGDSPSVVEWERLSEAGKDRYRVMAKAALSALQDPTPAMVEAGRDAANAITEPDFGADEDFAAIFRAMLAAAEGEG